MTAVEHAGHFFSSLQHAHTMTTIYHDEPDWAGPDQGGGTILRLYIPPSTTTHSAFIVIYRVIDLGQVQELEIFFLSRTRESFCRLLFRILGNVSIRIWAVFDLQLKASPFSRLPSYL